MTPEKFWKHQPSSSMTSLLWLAVICCVISQSPVDGIKDGLYDTDTDFVKTLDADTYETHVIKSVPHQIWIVEFYNSWCGHCMHFAPTWKQLAKDMKDWSDLVVISAIDCSQPKNIKPCRQFDITAYPTMKMIPPADLPGRLDKVAPIRTQVLSDIKTIILDFMTEFTPASWPRLKPLDQMGDLWQEKNVHSSQLFIIFEEKKSVVGRQVVLDLRNVTGILVRIMLKDQVLKYGITEYPSLYSFNKDATYSKLAVSKGSPELDRPNFVRHIIEEIKTVQTDSLKVVPVGKPERSDSKNNAVGTKLNMQALQPNGNQVNMQDLESALHYSLRQEIAICQTIEGEQFEALKSYINILRKYFPGRGSVQRFLAEVWKMLTGLARPSLTGEEWMGKLDNLQTENQYLPEVIQWASCRGSSPQYRGFPCSMWTMFHVLTVGAHAQSRGRTPGDPREVLLAIRGYMKQFFGCSQCSKHFLEMSQNVSSEVTSHTQSVLWLWRRHNQVNQRLHGDQSEDPKFPKVQFPPESLCATCKSAVSHEWDEEKVLMFLLEFYSESGIFSPEDLQSFQKEGNLSQDSLSSVSKDEELDWWEKKQEVRDLKHVKEIRLRRRNRKRGLSQGASYQVDKDLPASQGERVGARRKVSTMRSLWGLTELDLSMCVVFYIISTVIILLLYHHFIIRRHMNPCRTLKTKSISL